MTLLTALHIASESFIASHSELGYGFPDVGTRLKQFPILLTDVTETGAITKLYERYGGDGE
jgi:hypothetical protein